MTEVRTTSATGGEKGTKPERHDLLPGIALDEIARVFGFGTIKYDDHNWRRGYEWSKSYAALQRHILAWWSGEDVDPESGLSHLGHAGFHILALLTFESDERYAQYDDRYRPEEAGIDLGEEFAKLAGIFSTKRDPMPAEETPDETFQRLPEDVYVVAERSRQLTFEDLGPHTVTREQMLKQLSRTYDSPGTL